MLPSEDGPNVLSGLNMVTVAAWANRPVEKNVKAKTFFMGVLMG